MMRLFSGVLIGLAAAIVHGTAPELTPVANPLNSYYPLCGRIQSGPDHSLVLCRREFGLAAWSVYNPGPETMFCRIDLSLNDGGLRPILREAVHIRARLGQLPADVLPELSPDRVIAVAPGENRQIFLEIDTRNGRPGKYVLELRICNLRDGTEASRKIKVELLETALPVRHPLQIMTWDCSLRQSAGTERNHLLTELQDHYVNNFHVLEPVPWQADSQGELIGDPDFSRLDPMVKYLKGRGRLLLRCARPNPRAPDVHTPEGAKAYGQFVKALAGHLKKIGFAYDDYVLYPFDENTGDQFYACVRAAKQAVPEVWCYADPVRAKGELRRITVDGAFCDYMQLNGSLLKQSKTVEMVRPHLKVLSAYWCPVIQKRLTPEWYREMGHTAWRLNLNGIGYWSSLWLIGRGSFPWDDFRGKAASPVTLYPARRGRSIPSRRWKGFRAGLEDWLIFDQVRQKGNSELLRKIKLALDRKKGSPADLGKVRGEAIGFLRGEHSKIQQTAIGGESSYPADRKPRENLSAAQKRLMQSLGNAADCTGLPKAVRDHARMLQRQLTVLRIGSSPDELKTADTAISEAEKITVMSDGRVNPKIITVRKNQPLRLRLFNLHANHSVWVRLESDDPEAEFRQVMPSGKSFRLNQGDLVNLPAGEAAMLKIKPAGRLTRIIVYPLDHFSSRVRREIQIGEKK